MSDTFTISVSRENFSKLLTTLKTFENVCVDCDIQNGLFRCRTNDRQAIISMDLASVIEHNNLSFSLIKNKVGLLKSLEVDDNVNLDDKTVILESNESNNEFYDPLSRISFRKPVQRYIDNQFISDDDFNTMLPISEDRLLFSYTFTHYMKKRISNISIGFGKEIIDATVSEGKASFKIVTENKEDTAMVAENIVLNQDLGEKTFKFITLPFILDVISDLKFDCYTTSSNDMWICKFSQVFYGIPIILYTKVKVSNLA